MKKPVLVVMAAGMGSRYGGLKQIDPVGPNGEIIMDYSIHDALEAGFNKVVFIIKVKRHSFHCPAHKGLEYGVIIRIFDRKLSHIGLLPRVNLLGLIACCKCQHSHA